MLEKIKSQLIVSCQAPANTPLHEPKIIAAIALACALEGAKGLRIDSPEHIKAVREILPSIPLIGLWKKSYSGYEVYITPTKEDALAVSASGADIIAIDATSRERPETVEKIIKAVQQEGKLVMADVDSRESAIAAQEAGADLVATTLYGYTANTQGKPLPGFELLAELTEILTIPVICEGGVKTPSEAIQAIKIGAYSVVVGTAITGINQKAKDFISVFSC